MNALIMWLKSKDCPFPGIAAVAELADLCQETFNKVNIIAGSIVGIEILLEHHGLLTPETLAVVREKMAERMRPKVAEDNSIAEEQALRSADSLLVKQEPPHD